VGESDLQSILLETLDNTKKLINFLGKLIYLAVSEYNSISILSLYFGRHSVFY
jgi:hypothetical protein